MKVRNGYVSNSSSSSFIVIGERIKDPWKALKSGKKVMAYVPGGGTSGEAEDWSMFVDEETLTILTDSDWFGSMPHEFWAVFDGTKTWFDESTCNDKFEVAKDMSGEFLGFCRDYSSPDDKKQLIKFLGGTR